MSSKRIRTSGCVQSHEVLKYGETMSCASLLNECNIFWVREADGKIECYYQSTCGGELKKMTTSMCSQLWDLEKKHLHPRFNEQVLPNGYHVIPRISPLYLGKAPLKNQCTTKISKQAITSLNTTLQLYNFGIATSSTIPASRIVIPPGMFTTPNTMKAKKKRARSQEHTRLQLIGFLESMRSAACVSHLVELENNELSRANSVSDLVGLSVKCGEGETSINIAKYLICLYHLLFPVDARTSS